MNSLKQRKLSSEQRLLPWACDLLIGLLLAFAANGARAQQGAPAANQPAPQAAATGNAAPAVSQVPAPPAGAPRLGFGVSASPTVSASSAPAKPAATPMLLHGIDPVTGAPISTLVQTGPAADEASAGNSQETALAGNSSVEQGLKVHGHWVINVRNPDGTLVEHREFENSLVITGQGSLVGLLSGYLVPGDWMIVLGPQSGNGACNLTYEFCGLIHNAATYPAQGYCNAYYCTGSTLSYTYNFGTDFGGPYSIVLTGSITANQTGTIGTVTTLLNTCANNAYSTTSNPNGIETTSPATCVTQTTPQTWYGPFTSTNITPIPVTDGQLVQAIVTITFS
jgi:hypothetical protein